MKKLVKIFGIATIACAFASSCVEKEPQRSPSPVVDDSMTNAFFTVKSDTKALTMDPSSPAPYEIPVALDKPAENDMSLNIIVKKNTDNVFIVPESVRFLAGEQETKLAVTFDAEKTEKGKQYTLEIILGDEAYNPYKTIAGGYPGYMCNVLFEKWNKIGTGVFSDAWNDVQTSMTLYQLDGENLYELREWPYKPLYEYYWKTYGDEWAKYEDEMKGVSAEKIIFSLYNIEGDKNTYVKFESFNTEWYDETLAIRGFYPSDLAASLEAANLNSKLLNGGNVIQIVPYFYLSDGASGGWGLKQILFQLDNGVTIPVK